MRVKSLFVILLLVGAGISFARWQQHRPRFEGTLPPPLSVSRPGSAASEPRQSACRVPPWRRNGSSVAALAKFEATVTLISKKAYTDREAPLSPIDIAVAWGWMASHWKEFKWDHSWRYIQWETDQRYDSRKLQACVANIHVIPRDLSVLDRLRAKRPDELVHLAGYLVQVDGPNGYVWRSSLTRTDGGKGACEVLWLEDVR
jgi:hypothetical protein